MLHMHCSATTKTSLCQSLATSITNLKHSTTEAAMQQLTLSQPKPVQPVLDSFPDFHCLPCPHSLGIGAISGETACISHNLAQASLTDPMRNFTLSLTHHNESNFIRKLLRHGFQKTLSASGSYLLHWSPANSS